MELEKRVEITEKKTNKNKENKNYYTPNNLKENLIDSAIALTILTASTASTIYQRVSISEYIPNPIQLVVDLYYSLPFINS